MESQLFERDWRFMLDAVYRINSVDSVELLERETLECLAVLTPCTQGTFFIAHEGEQGMLAYDRPVVVGQQAHYMDDFLKGDYGSDPDFKGMGLLPQTEVFRDSDVLPSGYREKSSLYKNIYEKQGIYYPMRSYLVYKHKLIGNISLFNSKNAGDFSDKDLNILTIMSPHIALKLGLLLDRESKRVEASDKSNAQMLTLEKYRLTAREQEVASLIASGMHDEEIADSLCISVSTLKKHVYNTYKKLNVNNRIQLCSLLRESKQEARKFRD